MENKNLEKKKNLKKVQDFKGIFIKKSIGKNEFLNPLEEQNNYDRNIHKIHIEFFKNYIFLEKASDLYKFKDKELERICTTHPSFTINPEFQRLEFLGDRLLTGEISKILFKDKDKDEGELSLQLSELVKAETLAKIGRFLVSDIKYNGKLNNSIISDCLEAWIGAIYIDGGDVLDIILKLWQTLFYAEVSKNPKNILQELAEKQKVKLLYKITENKKEDYINFNADVFFDDLSCVGYGKSKQEASVNAAFNILKMIEKK